jgi:hypothetical protein
VKGFSPGAHTRPVREEAVDAVTAAVRERMIDAAQLRVPLEVDIGTGRSWDEAHRGNVPTHNTRRVP